MEAGFEYPESDELRTQDSRYSVIRIGDEIAQILQDAGIDVLPDTEPNDYPNYNGAYERMRQTIEGYLAAYPTIQMVLDLHRDAAEDAGGVPVALTAYPDGEACAELMLVVGTDEGGLPHPDWQENLANALKLQALLNRSAPGLCRDLDLRTERFNQHETPGSLLVEVGASGNKMCIRDRRRLRAARTGDFGAFAPYTHARRTSFPGSLQKPFSKAAFSLRRRGSGTASCLLYTSCIERRSEPQKHCRGQHQHRAAQRRERTQHVAQNKAAKQQVIGPVAAEPVAQRPAGEFARHQRQPTQRERRGRAHGVHALGHVERHEVRKAGRCV